MRRMLSRGSKGLIFLRMAAFPSACFTASDVPGMRAAGNRRTLREAVRLLGSVEKHHVRPVLGFSNDAPPKVAPSGIRIAPLGNPVTKVPKCGPELLHHVGFTSMPADRSQTPSSVKQNLFRLWNMFLKMNASLTRLGFLRFLPRRSGTPSGVPTSHRTETASFYRVSSSVSLLSERH